MPERKLIKINGFSLKMNIPDKRNGGGREKGYKMTEAQRTACKESKEKLNPNVQRIIVEGLRNGLSMKRVCNLVKVHSSTILRWLKQGEQGKSEKYINFYNECKLAEVQCEESCIKVVRKAIDGDLESTKTKKVYSKDKDTGVKYVHAEEVVKTRNAPSWTAAMTFLERKYPDRWGRYDRLTVGGDAENPIIPKQDMLDFLTSYIGKENIPIDVESNVLSKTVIPVEKKEEDLLVENR
ncbi:hypothetical protein LCGC14_1486440 [marine sediment metagenome]|uniref:Helix-turn-helix domain-containing protein n=1 Tax=marine sediment metagenome TaxID=412755 RepID=A0A0F9M9X5_9ZZZZ